jgi:hypothetical protein
VPLPSRAAKLTFLEAAYKSLLIDGAEVMEAKLDVILTAPEIAELFLQPAATKADGGYQSLLVALQEKINRSTGELALDAGDVERIRRYAFNYGNGRGEDGLVTIFGRTLGPKLDRLPP